ncbi:MULTISPECIES: sensor domain-containing diguanylate cyclase [unclassified Nocardia]|uniref:sensor domain-containing diguanylate cyclase n=1 Tax=unclassified Nocardia TaxID=2637762 RepID=UPI001CE3C126|nr:MULTISPECIES: sensor domain-containing diguanylate cyclase [unclassified Nocardia]
MRPDPTADALAREWQAALTGTSFVPLHPAELHALLAGFVAELRAALDAEPFDPSVAARVGAGLVQAHLTNPDVLSRSTPTLLALTSDSRRLIALLGELSAGYTAALLAQREASKEALQLAVIAAQRAAESRFRAVFDNAGVAITVVDTAGLIVDANPTLARMLDRPIDALYGLDLLDFAHPDERVEIPARVRKEIAAGTVRLETRYRRGDGDYGFASWTVSPVPNTVAAGTHLLVVGEDTTERRVLQAKLDWQARHDPLTGLANRAELIERLETMLESGDARSRLSHVLFVDLDRFKQINDSLGHAAGDAVLQVIAQRLRRVLPPGDAIARLGGDEFAVLLGPGAPRPDLGQLLGRLEDAVAEPVVLDGGHRLTVSASIGVTAVRPFERRGPEQLLHDADLAMYRTKTRRARGQPPTYAERPRS